MESLKIFTRGREFEAMESAIVGVPALWTKHCLPLDWKQQILCPYKMRKSPTALKKNLASMRVRCENTQGARIDIDRRRLLLSSSTLGVSAFTIGKAKSEPFPAPDLIECVYPTELPKCVTVDGGCCPPFTPGTTPVDFEFPTSLPMRIRKAAHQVDQVDIEKYNAALTLMKALPAEDPRSFHQQANVHCAYCNGAYKVGSDYMLVHKSWFFAPFHRWYLYFYERILGSLIGDDTFALPFWNWDDEEGMEIPHIFTKTDSSLYDANRDVCHQPPTKINLGSPTSCKSGDVESNYSNIYTHMVSGAGTAELFHGGAYRYRPGNKQYSFRPCETRVGTLECSPHNFVHDWTGSCTKPHREDMGSLYSAGRDPLFYSHHCNVDRMWFIWNCTLSNRNYEDKDLKQSKFLFYDENKQLVQVKAGDCYDTNKLRYQYEKVDKKDLPWYEKGRSLKKAGKLMPKPSISAFKEPIDELKKLTSPVVVPVERQNKTRTNQELVKLVEVLSIEGLEMDRAEFSRFNIFINYPEADSSTPFNSPHYAGSFSNFGHGNKAGKSMTYNECFKVGISETLEDLGAAEDENILVTLVPEAPEDFPKTPIKFASVKIEYVPK